MALIFPVRSPSTQNWRIAFGPETSTLGEKRSIKNMGITHVLDLRAEAPSDAVAWAILGVAYHRDPEIDDGRRQPVSSYVDGVSFAKSALSTPGAKVLIHCAAGQYRSPAMVYAVLRAGGILPVQAWDLITAARSNVDRQYVAGAEAAVPSLPTIPGSNLFDSPAGSPVAGAFLVAAGVGMLAWAAWSYRRHARQRA